MAPSPSGSRVVVAPDSFKGSISAVDATTCLAEGWRAVRPFDEVIQVPMADGGEGTVDAFATSPGAEVHAVDVLGPYDSTVRARWVMLSDDSGGTAAVAELASASGIEHLLTAGAPLRPMTAHTYGFGRVIRAALDSRVDRLVLGIGGSASTDGGLGVLTALGLRALDSGGAPVPFGAHGMGRVASIDARNVIPPPPGGALVLCDVETPLLGEDGAARRFAPQKGADAAQVNMLETALERWAAILGADPRSPGAGAAGGVGLALSWWGARLGRGAGIVAELHQLAARVRGADVVVTGEGRFDAQSRMGKVPDEVLRIGRATGKPVALVAGAIDHDVAEFDASVELSSIAGGVAAALADSRRWVREAGRLLASRWDAGGF